MEANRYSFIPIKYTSKIGLKLIKYKYLYCLRYFLKIKLNILDLFNSKIDIFIVICISSNFLFLLLLIYKNHILII